jgi:hypothetical protein
VHVRNVVAPRRLHGSELGIARACRCHASAGHSPPKAKAYPFLHANGTSQICQKIRRGIGDPSPLVSRGSRSPLHLSPLTTITCYPMEIPLDFHAVSRPPSRLIDLHSTCPSDHYPGTMGVGLPGTGAPVTNESGPPAHWSNQRRHIKPSGKS